MALEGEAAAPRVPAPPQLVPLFRFARLSSASYDTIHRVVDEDDEFRARVAATVDDASAVGQAGWLWLHRPDGWQDDPAFDDGMPTGRRGGSEPSRAVVRAKERAARDRAAREDADERRRRAESRATELAAALSQAEADRDRYQAEAERLGGERQEAVRARQEADRAAADLRRDLKVARRATREAEADLARTRRELGERRETAAPPSEPAPEVAAPEVRLPVSAVPAPAAEPVDLDAARLGVDAAAIAAADLARALADVATALRPGGGAPSGPAELADASDGDRRDRAGRSPRQARRATRRRPPQLPPGILDDSVEAHRHLVAASGALLVVDGYNLARTAWTALEPEEERRRTVALLEETAARRGAPVTVVFDGDGSVAPAASRSVRTVFSAAGVTADEAIADLLHALSSDQEVVVVSSDREVLADARSQGAATLTSPQFLAASGR